MCCSLYFAIHVADFLYQFLLGVLAVLQELSHNVLVDLQYVVRVLAVEVSQVAHFLLDVDRDASDADSVLLVVGMRVLGPVPELFIRDVLKFAFEQVGRAVEDVQYLAADVLLQDLVPVECGLQYFLRNLVVQFFEVIDVAMVVG